MNKKLAYGALVVIAVVMIAIAITGNVPLISTTTTTLAANTQAIEDASVDTESLVSSFVEDSTISPEQTIPGF